MLHRYFHIFGMFQVHLRMGTDRGGWKGVREEDSRVADEKRRFQDVIKEAPTRLVSGYAYDGHESCPRSSPMVFRSTRVVSLLKLPQISFSKFVNWELLDNFRGQTGLETLEGRFSEKASIRIIWNHLGNIVTLNL